MSKMNSERKPFAYVNKYTGKMFYLSQQPDAATDTDVYFPLWLHPQSTAQDADHIPDAGKMAMPEGWKMVPVEPTDEMISAGDVFMFGTSQLGAAYEAMLAVAPELPNG
jgi:hypothetical protein